MEYGQLVLATGSEPIHPSIEGIDLERVFHLHVPSEAEKMRALIEADEVDHAVIIGAGSIGLEAAESLFAHAVDVTIIEKEAQVLSYLLDPDLAAFVADELKTHEMEIVTSEEALRIEGTDDGHISKVVTSGREIETDLVLIAVGVKPNVKLASKAGLEIGATGAISVNEHFQTSDPAIFAGGDCVENRHRVTGKKIYIPLGSTANKHGRVIGNNLTGEKESFPGVVGTAILKSMNLTIARTGLTLEQAKEAGFDPVSTLTPVFDKAHFYPGGKSLTLKLIADRKSGKLLGAQGVGAGEIARRIDMAAAALTWGGTLKELSDLDLAYAPPYATAVDAIAHAANHTRNRIDGIAQSIGPEELDDKLAAGEDFVFLDVRQPAELQKRKIDLPQIQHIPLTELREHPLDFPPETEIVLFCQSGLRSYEAYCILQSRGFENAIYLDGGLRMGFRENRTE